MPSTNDITGDDLISKPSNEAYRSGWCKIYCKDGCVNKDTCPADNECPAPYNPLTEELG